MNDRVVLTMKWGEVFPASYVNRLFSAVSENIDRPFKFVCLTNETEGLHPDIVHFPLPDLDLPAERYAHGAWPKLAAFKDDLYGLTGRCLFIDLDTIISGNLEPFFDFESPFAAIGSGDDWRRGRTVTKPELASGVFAFDLGTLPHVLENFLRDKDDAYARYPNEQSFIEGQLKAWDPWPASWVVSFKRHLCHPIGRDLISPPHAPDETTKIVAFHGDPRPIDLVGRKGLWTKFPHSVRCPVEWLDAYWARHG
ncbi:MAG: hypothetical protein HKN27_02025 [Silicimonas sp.]|nr:hypothetical protein [Silicimonas sp.]